MSESEAIQVLTGTGMTVNQIVLADKEIQRLYKEVMVKNVHYGVVPGCKKPSLWKPGAEKIAQKLGIRADVDVTEIDLGNDHRNFIANCVLRRIEDNAKVGSHEGSCSTKESSMRYRSERLTMKVPNEYWKTRDPKVLGDDSLVVKKKGNFWNVYRLLEVRDVADMWSRARSIAQKRAFVGAVRILAACSDIFTDSLEDMKSNSENSAGYDDFDEDVNATEEPEKPKNPYRDNPAPPNGKPKPIKDMSDLNAALVEITGDVDMAEEWIMRNCPDITDIKNPTPLQFQTLLTALKKEREKGK